MILSSLNMLGHDVVIEYSPAVTWASFQVSVENNGADVDVFVGKLSLAYSNHWRCGRGYGKRLLEVVSGTALCLAATIKALAILPMVGRRSDRA